MAHHVRASANSFAQNDDFSNEYDSLEQGYYLKNEHSATPSQGQMTEHASNTGHQTPASTTQVPLRVHVEYAVRKYFAELDDEIPTDVYELILKQVERPLLTVVLEQTRGNQTKCAQILGLNRGTLRKKLKMYGLMA
jgi:Fis family transcriptional regulator